MSNSEKLRCKIRIIQAIGSITGTGIKAKAASYETAFAFKNYVGDDLFSFEEQLFYPFKTIFQLLVFFLQFFNTQLLAICTAVEGLNTGKGF